MPFTVKKLFARIDLPDDELREHRLKCGKNIRSAWNNSPYSSWLIVRIEEDNFHVNEYPDCFIERARKVSERYIRKNQLPIRKRDRKLKSISNG